METDQFKNTLKEMVEDFTVPVNEHLFDGVLHKKKLATQQRKKRRVIVAVVLLIICSTFGLYLGFNLFNRSGHSTASMAKSPQQKQTTSNGRFTENSKNVLEHQQQSITKKNTPITINGNNSTPFNHVDGNKEERYQPINKRQIRQRKNHQSNKHHQIASTNSPITITHNTTPTLLLNIEHKADKEAKVNSSNEDLLHEKSETKVGDKAVALNEGVTPTHLKKVDTIQQEKLANNHLLSVKQTESELNVLPIKTDSAEKSKVKATGKPAFGVYVNGTYHFNTSAKNVSSFLPAKFTDTLGLREKANYAYGVEAGFLYQATPQLSFMLGLGYHTVQFDEIRQVVTTKLDSQELFSNTMNQKILDAFPINYATETRLSWFDVPLWVKYRFLISKRVNYYAQTGFSVQQLIAQKGYAIVENMDGTSTFTPYDNYELSRFSKTQFVWLLSGGMDIRLHKGLYLNAGLNYRKHLTSYYKSDYVKRNPADFFGFTSGLTFVF